MDVVFARANGHVPVGGTVAHVQKGQHWPPTDPVVRARPDLFSTDPRYGMLHTPGHEPPGWDAPEGAYESATNVPGERRSVRRS